MTRLGAILAGGRSSRFGADKGVALLAGTPLIDHVVEALRYQCDDMVIAGREWPGLLSIDDRPAPDQGPLGGLCAALHYARQRGHDEVVCAGCDTLPVPSDLAVRLSPGPAVVEGHWLLGLWPSLLAEELDAWLAGQPDRAIRAWMRRTRVRTVPLPGRLFNINTPEALAEAEARLINGQS